VVKSALQPTRMGRFLPGRGGWVLGSLCEYVILALTRCNDRNYPGDEFDLKSSKVSATSRR
jgi:hypothetical protein